MTSRTTSEPRICHCELSGELLVIENKVCELCVIEEAQPFTPETVNRAFEWYREKITALQKALGIDGSNNPTGNGS